MTGVLSAYAEYGSQQGSPVLHFHGAGSSRLEHPGRDDDPPTTAVRLVVVDRPGSGGLMRSKLCYTWPFSTKEASPRACCITC